MYWKVWFLDFKTFVFLRYTLAVIIILKNINFVKKSSVWSNISYVTGKVKRDLWIEKLNFYFFGEPCNRQHPLYNATNSIFLAALVFAKISFKVDTIDKKVVNKIRYDKLFLQYYKNSPPSWMRHFEFSKSNIRFVISDPKNPE